MGQSGNSGNGASPPFATKDGKPANQGSGGSGAHDFIRDPLTSAPHTGGGFDVTKQNRPQTEARPEVVPNPQEIPAGGKDMKADPGPVSATVSGTAEGPQPRSPMKLHNPPFSVTGHGMGVGPAAKGGPGQSGSASASGSNSMSSDTHSSGSK
jgi:hypothetical protein